MTERIVPLTRGQRKAKARNQRRNLRKKLKKNNGEYGVNSITDEVSYIIIYYTLCY